MSSSSTSPSSSPTNFQEEMSPPASPIPRDQTSPVSESNVEDLTNQRPMKLSPVQNNSSSSSLSHNSPSATHVPPLDPSHLISLNLNPLLSHLQQITNSMNQSHQKMSQMEKTITKLQDENQELRSNISTLQQQKTTQKKEKKKKEKRDFESMIQVGAKRLTDAVKMEFDMKLHRLKQHVEEKFKAFQESLDESRKELSEQCQASKQHISDVQQQQKEEFESQITELRASLQDTFSEMKESMKKETTNLIVEKKSEIVKETFDDSDIMRDINKCRKEVKENAAQIKQINEDFMDRTKRIIKSEMKNVKQTTVRTIMKQTTTQTSRLKYYVRNLYAVLRLDMRRLDDLINDYELLECTQPQSLWKQGEAPSLLLQKKCMGVNIVPKKVIVRNTKPSDSATSSENGNDSVDANESTSPQEPTPGSSSTDPEEDAEIRVAPGVAVALDYIYQRTPLYNMNRKDLSNETVRIRHTIEESIQESEKEIEHKLRHLEKILETKVSKLLLSEALKDNDIILEMKSNFVKVRDHVGHILETFMTRDQIYACLRGKADVSLMNLKADRKFLNGVFDYLNEKITLLSTESNNEQLLSSIKQLEGKLKDITNRPSSRGSIAGTPRGLDHYDGSPQTPRNAAASTAAGGGMEAASPRSFLPGMFPSNNNSSMLAEQGVLGSTRCLSCNRSFPSDMRPSSAVAQKSKWHELPPSSIPSMPSVYSMDSSRRLESYRQYLYKTEHSEVASHQHHQDESFLGGGFKQSPMRTRPASAGSARRRQRQNASRGSVDTSMGMVITSASSARGSSSNRGSLSRSNSNSSLSINLSHLTVPTPPPSSQSGALSARGQINRKRNNAVSQGNNPVASPPSTTRSRNNQETAPRRYVSNDTNSNTPTSQQASDIPQSRSTSPTGPPMPDKLKSKVDYTSMAMGDEG